MKREGELTGRGGARNCFFISREKKGNGGKEAENRSDWINLIRGIPFCQTGSGLGSLWCKERK
jgi:hypothetical protein